MLLDIREISPQSVPINFLLPIKGTRLTGKNPPRLTTEYCIKVLCLASLMLPKADIRCAYILQDGRKHCSASSIRSSRQAISPPAVRASTIHFS